MRATGNRKAAVYGHFFIVVYFFAHIFLFINANASCIGIRYNIVLLKLVFSMAVITRECKYKTSVE
jgi:hypothetical protein